MPHLLLYGPPGTGKTSSVLAMCKELFGPNFYKQRVLELNASDERGIQVIREKVKTFAQIMVKNRPAEAAGFPCPPYKVIILDEADAMTHDAQAALRRVMEQYAKVTRFCILCNYVSKIIEPLASRCAKFRFQPIEDTSHIARLQHICQAENIFMAENTAETLVEISGGDLRRSVNLLQSSSALNIGEAIQPDSVREVAAYVPEHAVTRMIRGCMNANPRAVDAAVKDLTSEGYSGEQLLIQLHKFVVSSTEIPTLIKAELLTTVFPMVDERLTQGADEQLQLLVLGGRLQDAFQRAKKQATAQ